MKRVLRLLAIAGLLALASRECLSAEEPFGFEILQARAKALAAKPYSARREKCPSGCVD